MTPGRNRDGQRGRSTPGRHAEGAVGGHDRRPGVSGAEERRRLTARDGCRRRRQSTPRLAAERGRRRIGHRHDVGGGGDANAAAIDIGWRASSPRADRPVPRAPRRRSKCRAARGAPSTTCRGANPAPWHPRDPNHLRGPTLVPRAKVPGARCSALRGSVIIFDGRVIVGSSGFVGRPCDAPGRGPA